MPVWERMRKKWVQIYSKSGNAEEKYLIIIVLLLLVQIGQTKNVFNADVN